MHEKLSNVVAECIRRNASDIHISAGSRIYLRENGELVGFSDEILPAKIANEMIESLVNDQQREVLTREKCLDLAFFAPSGERFRGHVFHEKNGLSIAARKLESGFRPLAALRLPAVLAEFAQLKDGLVLFTGPTGSGKSTSLATLIHLINTTRSCHILTIEDPVEYVHENIRSLVRQRELYRDVRSFPEAVRASLREDPDVVLVGEMRDLDTMRAAITVAETGHLVFSTLHCGNAVGALDRLIGAFPSEEQDSLCQQLSMTLRAVVAQRLLPRKGGTGRVPAVEVLKVNKAVSNLIRNHKTEQLYTSMENGASDGMRTLEQSLVELCGENAVDEAVARRAAENGRVFERRMLMRGGAPKNGGA